MRKTGIILVLPLILLAALLMASCDSDSDSISSDDSVWKLKKDSQQIAENYLLDSPTFTFDGIKDSFEQSPEAEAAGPDKWRFLFSFTSTYEDYGDRSDEQLVKKETYHEAYITVFDGEVIKAVMDNYWDMIEQKSADDWNWGDAGKQALYGIISVFTILIVLTILTRAMGSIIYKMEHKQNAASAE